MSVKYGRPPSCRISRKKAGSVKKKSAPRQEWDSSVQDLTVHRATPEELAHRHEMHKSKNQYPAQLELLMKSLKKQFKKHSCCSTDLEERRVERVMEMLSDQYKTRETLKRADRAMAEVQDLIGDPRRHAGYPNVTVAPLQDLYNARGVIIQKKDPPTRLSTLSESVMDSQALNEVEETWSENSDDEEECPSGFVSELSTDRAHRILNEESLHSAHHRSPDPFVTPKGINQPSDGHLALNATAAVKKTKTRLTREERQEDEGSVIGRVLNPQPKIHRKHQTEGKTRRPPDSASSHTAQPPASCDASSHRSLDLLMQMMEEVDRELEASEEESGRQVAHAPQAQGLTGFSMSLVVSIKRLVSYVKECERQLRQEVAERQALKEELDDQRLLIDALTAEILSLKTGRAAPTILADPEPPPCPSHRDQPAPDLTAAKKLQNASPISSVSAMLASVMTELCLQEVEQEPAGSEAPSSGRSISDGVKLSRQNSGLYNFPSAVLLSPPRQKTQPLASTLTSLGTASSPPAATAMPAVHPSLVPVTSADTLEQEPQLPSPPLSCPSQEDPRSHERHLLDSCSDRLSGMAQLTKENNWLKARLDGFRGNSPVCPANKQEATSVQGPSALDLRIAELNRQSAEARDKLLLLIQQQKVSASVSPAISPITAQRQDTGGRERRLDGVIPMPCLTDSPREETPSPASRDSGRRSSASQRSCSSTGGRAPGDGQQIKRCAELHVPAIPARWSLSHTAKEDGGWFALSTHIS